MDDHRDFADIVADLDWLIGLLEKSDTAIAVMCLKMARMELQMKIHNITEEELKALCDLSENNMIKILSTVQ